MRILLINPPFYRLQDASMVHYPPGPCSIAASLEVAGFDSLVYNTDWTPDKKTIIGNINHLRIKALAEANASFRRRLEDANDPLWCEIREFIKDYGPDVVGISIFNTTLKSGIMVARLTKEVAPQAKVFVEGSQNRGFHCAIDPSTVVDYDLVDVAIRQEPEETAVEYIKALASGTVDLAKIQGLSWRKEGEVIHNEARPYVKNLDDLPWPARHKLHNVDKMPPKAHLSIYGSRGCPFKCKFCGCHTSWGYKPRLRSAKHMVDEIEHVHRTYGTRYFYLCDDIFFINKARALEFCDLLIERKLPVYFAGQTRAEICDDEILAAMKKAGGQSVSIGVESGSQRILDLMNKGNTLDDIRTCAKKLKAHGLRMSAFCILGLPEETAEEVQATADFIKELDPFICFPYLATPAVGTEMYEDVVAKVGEEAYEQVNFADWKAPAEQDWADRKKTEVVERAMVELARLNKKSMFFDFFKRPRFWWAYVNDTGSLSHPSHLWDYLMDFLR